MERWSWGWAISFGNENENEIGKESLSLKRRWTDEPVRKNGYCVKRNVRGSDASDSVSTLSGENIDTPPAEQVQGNSDTVTVSHF